MCLLSCVSDLARSLAEINGALVRMPKGMRPRTGKRVLTSTGWKKLSTKDRAQRDSLTLLTLWRIRPVRDLLTRTLSSASAARAIDSSG